MTSLHEKETPKERFVRLANSRVNKALKAVELIGNLSERSNYSYSDEEVTKIFFELEKQLRAVKRRFSNPASKNSKTFRL